MNKKDNLVQSQPVLNTIKSASTDETMNSIMELRNNRLYDIFSDSVHFASPQVNERYSQIEENYTNSEI